MTKIQYFTKPTVPVIMVNSLFLKPKKPGVRNKIVTIHRAYP